MTFALILFCGIVIIVYLCDFSFFFRRNQVILRDIANGSITKKNLRWESSSGNLFFNDERPWTWSRVWKDWPVLEWSVCRADLRNTSPAQQAVRLFLNSFTSLNINILLSSSSSCLGDTFYFQKVSPRIFRPLHWKVHGNWRIHCRPFASFAASTICTFDLSSSWMIDFWTVFCECLQVALFVSFKWFNIRDERNTVCTQEPWGKEIPYSSLHFAPDCNNRRSSVILQEKQRLSYLNKPCVSKNEWRDRLLKERRKFANISLKHVLRP